MEIRCKYPRIIRNPQLNDWVLSGFRLLKSPTRDYYIKFSDVKRMLVDGYLNLPELKIITQWKLKDEFMPSKSLPASAPYNKLCKLTKRKYRPVYRIDYETIHDITICNPETGEEREVFIIVPCNHCNPCYEAKRNQWSYRMKLQSQSSLTDPMFVTLTFDEEHYPSKHNDPAVHTDIIQKFLKRLRRYMDRNSSPTDFKYFICSEYGSKRGRLHFHGLFFNLHNCNYVPIYNDYPDKKVLPVIFKFTDYIRKAWKFGISKVEIARDNTGSYALKYMSKQNDTDKPTKVLHSHNFGKSTILEHVEDIRKYPELTYFTTLINGQETRVPIYNYVKNLSYPSVARQIPKEFRDLLRECVIYGKQLLETDFFQPNVYIEQYRDVKAFFESYHRVIDLCGYTDLRTPQNYEEVDWNFYKFNNALEDLLSWHFDWSHIYQLADLNQIHTCVTNVMNYDLVHENLKVIKNNSKIFNLECDGQ